MKELVLSQHSAICLSEKKSKDKREPFSPATPSKSTAAPRFLQGLTDLRVMDGSQVTMTVQVSGVSRHPLAASGSMIMGEGC